MTKPKKAWAIALRGRLLLWTIRPLRRDAWSAYSRPLRRDAWSAYRQWAAYEWFAERARRPGAVKAVRVTVTPEERS